MKKMLVMSVGGSLVVPNGKIDIRFLKQLKIWLEHLTRQGWQVALVVGGGGTARHYQQAAKRVGKLSADDLDWLGIHSTRLNGHLLRTILRPLAHPEMFNDPNKVPKTWQGKVLVAAGWRPGWSTDFVAVKIAERLGAGVVLNLSNIDYLYTADPKKDRHARPIKQINWLDFRRIVGDKWDPGMNTPFDPVAAQLAAKRHMRVYLVNGKKFANLNALLSGQTFRGTVIE